MKTKTTFFYFLDMLDADNTIVEINCQASSSMIKHHSDAVFMMLDQQKCFYDKLEEISFDYFELIKNYF